MKINNKGIATVEMILILVVLIGLVLIFRTQIIAIVSKIFNNITTQINRI